MMELSFYVLGHPMIYHVLGGVGTGMNVRNNIAKRIGQHDQ